MCIYIYTPGGFRISFEVVAVLRTVLLWLLQLQCPVNARVIIEGPVSPAIQCFHSVFPHAYYKKTRLENRHQYLFVVRTCFFDSEESHFHKKK